MVPTDRRQERELRPECCPHCRSKAVGTHAKVITTSTYWYCQACGQGWTFTPSSPSAGPRID